MNLTQITQEEKQSRSKKMMLWFGIGSLIMSFAGLISAFIVSSKREDWLHTFEIPRAFYIGVVVIVVSSLTFILAKKALEANNRGLATLGLVLTLILGIGFIYLQFTGFGEIIDSGINFTGATSNITMSYIYLIAMLHIAHVVVGLICIVVVIYNHLRGKYNSEQMLGFELAAIFWHFIDILWLVLFLFLYFFRDII